MIRAERTISTHFQSILYRKKPGKLLFLRCYKSCRYCKLYILNCVLIKIPTEPETNSYQFGLGENFDMIFNLWITYLAMKLYFTRNDTTIQFQALHL